MKDYILKLFTIIINDWNKVDPDIRNIDSYALFSKKLFNFKNPLNIVRSSHRGVLKKVLLKISQNSQKNTSVRVFLRKRLWHRCFPVNCTTFLRTPILQNTSRLLLLYSTCRTYDPLVFRTRNCLQVIQ